MQTWLIAPQQILTKQKSYQPGGVEVLQARQRNSCNLISYSMLTETMVT